MKEKGRKILEFFSKNGKMIFPMIVCVAVAVTVVIALKAGNVRMNELEQIGEPISTPESSVEPSETGKPEEVAWVKNESQEINSIIEKYYTALAQGDEEAILSVCDKVEERHMQPSLLQYIRVLYIPPGSDNTQCIWKSPAIEANVSPPPCHTRKEWPLHPPAPKQYSIFQ